MDTSNVIVMSMAIIILLLFAVFAVELLIPMQLKFEMNGICRSYIYTIESDGDLPLEDKNSLKKSLEEIGLKHITIEIQKEGNRYGDKVEVNIACDYSHKRLINLYSRKNKSLVLKFERIYFIRKIKN